MPPARALATRLPPRVVARRVVRRLGQVDTSTFLPSTDNPYVSAGFGVIAGSPDLNALSEQFSQAASSVGDQLSAAGVDLNTLETAVNQYKWIPQAAAQVARSFSTGNEVNEFNTTVSVACMAISTALPAAAPAVALIAAGLPVLEQLLSSSPDVTQCGYYVPVDGKFSIDDVLAKGEHPLCFRKKIPWGPSDPQWIKFDVWAQHGFTDVNGTFFPPDTLYCYFWEYLNIQCDWWSAENPTDPLSKFSPQTPKSSYPGMSRGSFQGTTTALPAAVIGFHKFFCVAWKANAELYINGHPYATLSQLLQTCFVLWQSSHYATSTYTINPKLGVEDQQEWTFHLDGGSSLGGRHLSYDQYTQTRGPCVRDTERNAPALNIPGNACWATETMVQMILGGQADDQRKAPLVLNTGAAYPVNGTGLTPTATAVAVAAGVPAVAVAGSIVYSLAQGKAWDYALSAAWKGVLEFFE